jgi:hypothetical protein
MEKILQDLIDMEEFYQKWESVRDFRSPTANWV